MRVRLEDGLVLVSQRSVSSTNASPGRLEVWRFRGHVAWNPVVWGLRAWSKTQLMLSQIQGAAPLPWSTPKIKAASVDLKNPGEMP